MPQYAHALVRFLLKAQYLALGAAAHQGCAVPNDRPLVAIVNKDATFVQLLDTVLRDQGYDTLLVEAGDIAHQSIKQQRPHVIILDIDSGAPAASWRLVDLLYLDPETAQIPLIICSLADQALAERRDKLIATGGTIVEKPFLIDELLTPVRTNVKRPEP